MGRVTLIVHTDDAIFEFTGEIPAGEIGRGYFNLMRPKGLRGHLRHERCDAIAFVERPFMGKSSAFIAFINIDGGIHVQGVRRPRRGARAASGPACTFPCHGREDRREVGHAASYIASCLREMTMHQTMIGTKIRRCLKVNALIVLCVAQLPAASFAASDQVLLPRNLSPWGMFVMPISW